VSALRAPLHILTDVMMAQVIGQASPLQKVLAAA